VLSWIQEERVNYNICAANGIAIHTYRWLPLNLNLGLGRDFTWRFVVADVTYPLIGVGFLSHFGLLVDCQNNRLLDGVTSSVRAQAASSLIPSVKTITGGTPANSLLTEFSALTRPAGVQREVRHNTLHHMWTIPGPPVTCRPRRLAPDRLAIAKAKIDAMLQNGTARRSKSSWSSALHIVPKKENGWRPCDDYRALNARTIPDRYPIRHIHDYSPQPFGCSIFSKIDLVRACNQIPVHPDDVQRNAITIPFGLFEFPFMFLVLRSSAQTFKHFMDDILWGVDFCFAYLDDTYLSSPGHSKSTNNTYGLPSTNFRGTGSSSTRRSVSFEHTKSPFSVTMCPPRISNLWNNE
jgi:hypothetical protein